MEFEEQTRSNLALISGYGEGGFRVSGKRHEGHLLVFETGFYPWPLKSIKTITKQSLKVILEGENLPEFLLFGLGDAITDQVILARKLEKKLGLPIEVMTTGAAARTYNVLTLEGRRVGAGLFAV